MSSVIGINGFGRTGRNLLRALISESTDFKLAAINDAFLDAEKIAHAILFDTVNGRFAGRVEVKSKNSIVIDGNAVLVYQFSDPQQIPWSDAGVQVVLEASGVFSTAERSAGHLNGGASRVVVCGPSPDLPVVIAGVNDNKKNAASENTTGGSGNGNDSPTRANQADAANAQVFCTGAPILAALGPFLKIVQDVAGGIGSCSFVSVQPPMSSMKCTDAGGVRDLRLGRGQVGNLIPQPASHVTKTFSKLFPRLGQRIGGTFVYTAQTSASLLDITLNFDKAVSVNAIVDGVRAFAARDEKSAKIAGVETEPVVSSDFNGSTKSFIVDVGASAQITESTVKMTLWSDCDSACARRILDVLK